MSKPHALGWAAVWGIAALCCFAIGLGMCGIAALLAALAFGFVWFMKMLRDYGMDHAVEATSGEAKTLPPVMTSPGSKRLFVPPSLDH